MSLPLEVVRSTAVLTFFLLILCKRMLTERKTALIGKIYYHVNNRGAKYKKGLL